MTDLLIFETKIIPKYSKHYRIGSDAQKKIKIGGMIKNSLFLLY